MGPRHGDSHHRAQRRGLQSAPSISSPPPPLSPVAWLWHRMLCAPQDRGSAGEGVAPEASPSPCPRTLYLFGSLIPS